MLLLLLSLGKLRYRYAYYRAPRLATQPRVSPLAQLAVRRALTDYTTPCAIRPRVSLRSTTTSPMLLVFTNYCLTTIAHYVKPTIVP